MMRWLNRVLPTPILLVVLIYFLLYGGFVLWIVSLEMRMGGSIGVDFKNIRAGEAAFVETAGSDRQTERRI